jgi:DNA-directed RNA polymerase specialized sigma24 family protein
MGIESAPLAFEKFKRDQASAFERIARRTRGTHDAQDLVSEAWLIAIDIGKRRGAPVDLSNRAEQDQVLAWLYKRFVDYVRGKRKESIDCEQDDHSRPWHERLATPADSDPLAQLIRNDEELSLTAHGYSQYSAYITLLRRFEFSLLKLADYLAITFATLSKRIEDARDLVNRQPTLFDRTEQIDPDFDSRPGWMRKLWERCQSRTGRLSAWLSKPNRDLPSNDGEWRYPLTLFN